MDTCRVVILVVLSLVSTLPVCDADCHTTCKLPDCYCEHEKAPSSLFVKNVPPMVLFAFSGGIAYQYWEFLEDIFPDTLTNPNDCPVAITFFVRGTFDPCTVSALYRRGHEIATQGDGGFIKWDEEVNWNNTIAHRDYIEESAGIPKGHVVGVRAPDNKPGGNLQIETLGAADFLYDSSLILDFYTSSFADPPYWPFTMTSRFVNGREPPCGANDKCPTEPFAEFWEVPLGGMFLPLEYQINGHSQCQYLWQCALYAENNTILDMLKTNYDKHFSSSRGSNRAPFVINIQPNLFAMENVIDDLKEFVAYLREEKNAWLVTFQDAIKWMKQSPKVKRANIFSTEDEKVDQGTGVFKCPKRSLDRECASARFRPASYYTTSTNIFWACVVFLVLFFLFALKKR